MTIELIVGTKAKTPKKIKVCASHLAIGLLYGDNRGLETTKDLNKQYLSSYRLQSLTARIQVSKG